MRKVILNVAVSLDGFIEGPNGEYDWCFTDGDYGMEKFLSQTDAIFFGRKSYELFAQTDSSMWNDKKKYVFSRTLKSVDEGVTIINGDIEKAVQSVKEEQGKDIWFFGGASLTTSFINLGLVDELMIAIHPIILTQGKPLFDNIDKGRIRLEHIETKTYPSGLVQVFYKFPSEASR